MKAILKVLVGVVILTAVGCTTVDPSHSFGNAVRAMQAGQTVNPGAAAAGQPVIESGDPEVTKSALDNLRERTESKEARQKPR